MTGCDARGRREVSTAQFLLSSGQRPAKQAILLEDGCRAACLTRNRLAVSSTNIPRHASFVPQVTLLHLQTSGSCFVTGTRVIISYCVNMHYLGARILELSSTCGGRFGIAARCWSSISRAKMQLQQMFALWPSAGTRQPVAATLTQGATGIRFDSWTAMLPGREEHAPDTLDW